MLNNVLEFEKIHNVFININIFVITKKSKIIHKIKIRDTKKKEQNMNCFYLLM